MNLHVQYEQVTNFVTQHGLPTQCSGLDKKNEFQLALRTSIYMYFSNKDCPAQVLI